jgi:cytochrome P450
VPRLPGPRTPWSHLRWGLALQRDTPDTLLRLRQTFGPVFAVGYGPLRFVYLLSREANEYLLSTDPGNFRWGDVTKPLIPVDGPTALVVTDGDEHRRRRKLVQPAFHMKRINGYVDLMVGEVNRIIDSWRPGDERDAYAELRSGIRAVVVRALFGDRLRGQADELGRRLQPGLDFLNRSVLRQMVKVPVPGSAWPAAKRARRDADRLIDAEVAWRRTHGSGSDDTLGWLLEDGSLTDAELRDQVVSLIAAGYETTSATMGWCVYAALATHGVWGRARAEVETVAGRRPVRAEDLPSLRYVNGVVHEALRLYPAGILAGRAVVADFELHGHRIPAGSLVLYSPYVIQRLPELWDEPGRFLPDRWDPDSPDHREPAPYSFVTFGGGYRRCIGFAFATTELQVMFAELVRRVDLELASSQPPRKRGIATMYPHPGVPVRVVHID